MLVTIPAIMKDVRLGVDIGIDRFVHIFVELCALLGRPVFVAEVINDCAKGEVVTKGGVAFQDRAGYIFECHLNSGFAELFIPLYRTDKRQRNHF